MKVKKFKFKQILKLHLLKSRVYETSMKNMDSGLVYDGSNNLSSIIVQLKKALQTIFRFHQSNKRILFIGLPQRLELKINRMTDHVGVPSDFDLQGVILRTNLTNFKISKNNKNYFSKSFAKLLLPKLSKPLDLVVLISTNKPQTIVLESSIAKVPLITFENLHNGNSTYNVKGINNNLFLVNNINIFFVGLNFLFQIKPPKKRKSQKFQNSIFRSVKNGIR